MALTTKDGHPVLRLYNVIIIAEHISEDRTVHLGIVHNKNLISLHNLSPNMNCLIITYQTSARASTASVWFPILLCPFRTVYHTKILFTISDFSYKIKMKVPYNKYTKS